MEKITEHMWCNHCDHEWDTDDYFECKNCPNCTTEPVTIMRTSGFGFMYAHIAKHKAKYHPELTGEICVENCDFPKCEVIDCTKKISA